MEHEGREHEVEVCGVAEWERPVEPVVGLGVQCDARQLPWPYRTECVRYPSWEFGVTESCERHRRVLGTADHGECGVSSMVVKTDGASFTSMASGVDKHP